MEFTLKTIVVMVLLMVATFIIASVIMTWNSNSTLLFSSGLEEMMKLLTGGS